MLYSTKMILMLFDVRDLSLLLTSTCTMHTVNVIVVEKYCRKKPNNQFNALRLSFMTYSRCANIAMIFISLLQVEIFISPATKTIKRRWKNSKQFQSWCFDACWNVTRAEHSKVCLCRAVPIRGVDLFGSLDSDVF